MLSLPRPRPRELVPEGPTKVKDIRGSTEVKGVYGGHCSNFNTLAFFFFFFGFGKSLSSTLFQNPDLAILIFSSSL